jgi:hypothetical protein
VRSSHKQLRPLIRGGDVYHILPQATGRRWDGLEYYDPQRGEGVVFVFRPRSPEAHQPIRLAGLAADDYEVRFEGGRGTARMSGIALQRKGLEVALPHSNSAAIIHLTRLRRPVVVAAAR